MKKYKIDDILTPNAIEVLSHIGNKFPDKTLDVVVTLDRLMKAVCLDLSIEMKKDNNWGKAKIDKYKQDADVLKNLLDFLKGTTGKELIPTKGSKSLVYQEYTLKDIFAHKHFVRMQIYDVEMKVDSSVDILKKTCEYLIDKDRDTFLEIVNSQSICGRTSPYFSTDIKSLRRGTKLTNIDGVFLETNHPADRVKQIIIALLKAYKIPLTEFKVYSVSELQHNISIMERIKHKVQS